MPDYLVFDTTANRKLTEAPIRRVNAADTNEAVAVVLLDTGFQPDQSFTIFRISQGVRIDVEQARGATLLDPADPTGTTVLRTYDEAALEVLKAARGG